MKYIQHVKNLDFTIIAHVEQNSVSFDIYDIEGWTEGVRGVFDVPIWHRSGSTHWPDPVSRVEEAERFLHGVVKWDGCSDWHFDEQDRNMLHSCGLHGLQRMGDVMAFCWNWASELLPNFDK